MKGTYLDVDDLLPDTLLELVVDEVTFLRDVTQGVIAVIGIYRLVDFL